MLRVLCIGVIGAAQLLFTVFVLAPLGAVLLTCAGIGRVWRWVELQAIWNGDSEARDRAEYKAHL